MAGTLCATLAVGACSSSSLDSNPFAQASSIFKPDTVTNAGKARYSAVVTSDDLISADGRCGGGAIPSTPEPLPQAAPDAEEPAGTVGQASRNTAALPEAGESLVPSTRGVALGMSECEVARRAGSPERVEVGTDERGERAVTLSYLRGERAGIYRFREGRLFTIERVIVEPEKPKKPVKPKTAARPAPRQAAAPAPASAPSTAQRQNQGAAPWPAPTQQQKPAQSQVWPSPPPARGSQQPSS